MLVCGTKCLNEHLNTSEDERLKELYNYEMLYTTNEETIDCITKLTSIICETPICLVSLLDKNKQWFKSRQGLDVEETDREISFCKYAIQQDHIFEVKNSLEDPRFINNPLVTGFPFIRYYAGMPLKSPNGYNIGTLCVIDTKPREMKPEQKLALETLAKQVILQFEMKKVCKELKLANEKSLKLSLVKDEFLSNMSHELRTPLNAIYGFTEILQNSVKDSKQKEYLDIIKSSVEILMSLINDILDFSKIELGKLVIEKKQFNIRKTIKEIFELLKQKALEKDLSLCFNISPKVPKSIIGDKIRLNQILVNLIGNAIKFTNQGKVEVNIKCVKKNKQKIIGIDKSDNKDENYEMKEIHQAELEFSVKDSGIGIRDDKLNVIFERFEQASSDITRKYGGSGLGLSISKNLVELQGGGIYVKSILGKGSEFIFKIPYEYDIHENSNTIKRSETDCENLFFHSLPQKNMADHFDLKKKKKIENNRFINELTYLPKEMNDENFSEKTNKIYKDNCEQIILENFRRYDEKERKKNKSNQEISDDHFEQSMDLTDFEKTCIYDTKDINNSLFKNDEIDKRSDDINDSRKERETDNLERKSNTTKRNDIYYKINSILNFKEETKDISIKNFEYLDKINILLCEDNNFNIKLIEKILFDSCYKNILNLDTAFNGKIGLEMIRNNQNKYDLILMDLQMPELNGLETTDLIRKELKLDIPIIAMTANICPVERKKCINIGINEYFTKPFNKKEFFDCFKILLKNKISKVFSNNLRNPSRKNTKSQSVKKLIIIPDNINTNLRPKPEEKNENSDEINEKADVNNSKYINKTGKNNYMTFKDLKNSHLNKINNFNFQFNEKIENNYQKYLTRKNPMNDFSLDKRFLTQFNNKLFGNTLNSDYTNSPTSKENYNSGNQKILNEIKSNKILNSGVRLYSNADKNNTISNEKLLCGINQNINEVNFITDKIMNKTPNKMSERKKNNSRNIKKPEIYNENNFNKKNIINFKISKNNKILNGNLKIKLSDLQELKCSLYNQPQKNNIEAIYNKHFEVVKNFYNKNLINKNEKSSDRYNKIIENKLNNKSMNDDKSNSTIKNKIHFLKKSNTMILSDKDEQIFEVLQDNLYQTNNNFKLFKEDLNVKKKEDQENKLFYANNFNNKIRIESKILDDINYKNEKQDKKFADKKKHLSNLKINKDKIKKIKNTDSESISPEVKIKSESNQTRQIGNINLNNNSACNNNNNNQYNIKNIFNFNIANEKKYDLYENNFNTNFEIQSIDKKAFNEFTDGDVDTEREIIESFLKEFPVLLDELENNIKKKDFDEIAKSCHKIKSPISLFGLVNFKERIIKIEDFSKIVCKNLICLKNNFSCIRLQVDGIFRELKNIIS